MATDAVGPGQCWARAAIEVCSRLRARDNLVQVRWVPAHIAMEGNKVADTFTKEAAGGRQYSVEDRQLQETSLSHLPRLATEPRSRATAQWISEHVQPERRYRSPAGPGLRRKAMRRVRKSLASRYYQLLSRHAAIRSFLQERITGPLHLESGRCRWCTVKHGNRDITSSSSTGRGRRRDIGCGGE